jgi:thioredoxin 1
MVTELNEDWEEVLANERISVVKCYADWCGPCKFYSPHFQRFSDNLDVYNDTEIKYYQSNNDKLKDFKERYNVDTLPTTLFLVHGVLVYRLTGVTRQSVIEKLLMQTLKTNYHKG